MKAMGSFGGIGLGSFGGGRLHGVASAAVRSFLALSLALPSIAAADPPEANAADGARPTAAPPVLTEDEREALEVGELSEGRALAGSLLSVWPGFGIGHAVQGRWRSSGWRFSAAQGVSYPIGLYGIVNWVGCASSDAVSSPSGDSPSCGRYMVPFVVGGTLFSIAYVWGIVDAIGGAEQHRRDYRRARQKQESGATSLTWSVAPLTIEGGYGVGAVGSF
jgi:hypothetical protein